MDSKLQSEIWKRLREGLTLDDLGLPSIGGRIDLRGIAAPLPVTQQKTLSGNNIIERQDTIVVRGARWQNLDISGSVLTGLRLFDCEIENCSLDGAVCKDWRLWNSRIVDSTFRTADLRASSLGGVQEGKRNSFRRVDFSSANLAKTVHGVAEVAECIFDGAKLAKVDFQGTVFQDCRFSGNLEEVLFYKHAFRQEAFPPNEMKRVDFSHARFQFVEFRGLDMETVVWPQSEQHVIVDNYRGTLDRVLGALENRADLGSKRIKAILDTQRKWAGANQRRGVVSKGDLVEAGGKDAADEVLAMLGGALH